jgi:hypothetical protein
LKEFKKELLFDYFSIIWVSFCAFSLAFGFSIWVNYSNALNYSLAVFFSSLIVYSLANFRNKSLTFFLILTFFSICSFYFFLVSKLNLTSTILLTISFIVSILYVLPQTFLKLREIPFLKILIVATIWIITSCIVPILNSKSHFSNYFLIFSIFLFLITNIIPFEIRDRKIDSSSLKTVAQVFGVKTSISIAFSLLLVSALLIMQEKTNSMFFYFYALNCIFLFVLIFNIEKFLKSKFYFILLDSSVFILALLLIILKKITPFL